MSAMKEWLGYHWLAEDRRLAYHDKTVVQAGVTYKDPVNRHGYPAEIALRSVGYHASKRAIDALEYAPGPVCCLVRLSGRIIEASDKACAEERTVLAIADATNVLHEFICWCAEKALKTAEVTDERCWKAIETKRQWLKGEATGEELGAAWAGAWAAAASFASWPGAWAGAWPAAASFASWAAAWPGAWPGAWTGAWPGAASFASWAAAWPEMNSMLESMLSDLFSVAGFSVTNTKGVM